jgi:probable 2-oxoglutarate dehydrogenase E1 component DHKTD1
VIRNFRKPLIVAAPKGLLRHPSAVSTLADMLPGTTFQTVLDDPAASAGVKRVVFVSGKHYYTLDKQRDTVGDKTTALVRLEVCNALMFCLCRFDFLVLFFVSDVNAAIV